MKRMYWNIWTENQGRFMLGSSFNFKEDAEAYLPKLKANLERINKGRVANGYRPIVDDYEVRETNKLYHLD